MRKFSLLPVGAACCLAIGLGGCAERPPAVERLDAAPAAEVSNPATLEPQVTRTNGKVEVISQSYDIDRPYLPMLGPKSSTEFRLLDGGPPERVWITGAHLRMVEGDARQPAPDDYMCRAELSLDSERRRAIPGSEDERSVRILALTAGQLNLVFPTGFGIPIWSDDVLTLNTQAQNLDFTPEPKSMHVRHRVTLDLVRQSDLPQPPRRLYLCVVSGLKSLDSQAVVFDEPDQFPDEALKRSACSPGVAFLNTERSDRFARRYTDHWVLEPGREANHTRVTTLLNLSADTTIHAIGVQVNPLAESVELVDLTTGESVFKGLGGMASDEGLRLSASHEYELISVYDNTSGVQRSAMAMLYLYLSDPPAGQ
jgi:hypothetical protein